MARSLDRVQRVSYNLTTWNTAPRRLPVDGHQVRLGGFHAHHPYTVDAIGSDGARLTLLVVPPETDPVTAHQVLLKAGRRDNRDSIDDLLAPTATAQPDPASELPDDPATARWEADGGRAFQRL